MRLDEASAAERDLVARLVGAGRLSRAALASSLDQARARGVSVAKVLAEAGLATDELARAAEEAARGSTVASAALGRYVLGGSIGRGGMGTVLRAYDPVLHRQVAVKVMNGAVAPGAEHGVRFAREAGAIAGIQHPGVVPLHDYGEDAGRLFFVMELVLGRSFDAWLEAERPPADAVARVVRGVCVALAHVHERGLIHRDLKPENVLVDEKGEARLADFGLTRRDDGPALTESGQILGSPPYMAPEQASDAKGVGPPSDIYGVGGLLHRALTGEPPNPITGQLVHLLAWFRDGRVKPVIEVAPHAAPALAALATWCLEKDPAARPASASVVIDELDRFLGARPERPRAPRRPAPRLLGALALLAAVSLGGGALLLRARAIEAEARDLVARAVAHLESGARDDAVRDATRAIELAPASASAWSVRGAARLARQEHAAAIEDATRAIDLGAASPLATVTRQEARLRAGDARGSLEDGERAWPLAAADAAARKRISMLRGEAHMTLGDHRRAAEAFDGAAVLAPDDARVLAARGAALARARDDERALEDLSRAIRLEPTLAVAWFERAQLRRKLGRSPGAIEDFRRVLELEPDSARAAVAREAIAALGAR